jgi:hypothetical protein
MRLLIAYQKTAVAKIMNDLQRSAKLKASSTRARWLSLQTGRRLVIYFLAALIVSVMIAWFGFLGWGFVAILQRLLDYVKDVWTHL